MSIIDLGLRILKTARKQGKTVLQDLEQEWHNISPHLRELRQQMRQRGTQFRNQVSAEVLRWMEDELNMSMGQWRVLLGQDPELENAYKTLELPYGTELNEVKVQWRKLLKQYHPDLHMASPQQQAVATRKSQSLTAAYHRIAKAFKEHRL